MEDRGTGRSPEEAVSNTFRPQYENSEEQALVKLTEHGATELLNREMGPSNNETNEAEREYMNQLATHGNENIINAGTITS